MKASLVYCEFMIIVNYKVSLAYFRFMFQLLVSNSDVYISDTTVQTFSVFGRIYIFEHTYNEHACKFASFCTYYVLLLLSC